MRGAPDVLSGKRSRREERRVLHIFPYYLPDYSGEAAYWARVFRDATLRTKHDVLVYNSAPPAGGRPPTAPERVVYFGDPSRAHHARYLALLWWIVLHGHEYAIAHVHSNCDRWFLSYALLRMFGCKLVFGATLDDTPAKVLSTYSRKYRPIVRQLLRLFAAWISISPGLFDGSGTVGARKLVMLPYGLSLSVRPKPSPLSLGERSKKGLVLLTVGPVDPRKDLLFLVDQLAALVESYPALRLFVVGPVLDEDYARALTARIDTLHLHDNVLLTRSYVDPTPYYELADIYVAASQLEGFGNAVLEALGAGIPVVARRQAGVSDFLIRDGRTGYLFDDAAQFRSFIATLAADPLLRRRIGTNARAHVHHRFRLRQSVDAYLRLYAHIGSGRDLSTYDASAPAWVLSATAADRIESVVAQDKSLQARGH